jgi:hypothetical protein
MESPEMKKPIVIIDAVAEPEPEGDGGMVLTAPPEAPLSGDPEAAPEIEEGWFRMDIAPVDGTLIEVHAGPGTRVIQARYRITRRREPQFRQWVVVGFWVNAITGEELSFHPAAWRLPEGFNQPGMILP